jgi:5-methylcytosine-specific restriction endonuclease McrA
VEQFSWEVGRDVIKARKGFAPVEFSGSIAAMETFTTYTCRKCNQTLPIARFYTGPSYSRNGNPHAIMPYCKPCKQAIQHARMSRKVVNRHGVELTKFQIAMYKHRGANWEDIGGFKCEHHPGALFHFHQKDCMWRCAECTHALRTHPLNRPDKMERLRKYAELKASAWGPEAVELLLAELVSGKKLRLDRLWIEVKLTLYERAFGRRVSKGHLKRWIELNRASGKPENNVGWTCQHCEFTCNDVRFFDLDHIIPRSQGGSDSPTNLQVLCPNCHRLKTIADVDSKAANESPDKVVFAGGR